MSSPAWALSSLLLLCAPQTHAARAQQDPYASYAARIEQKVRALEHELDCRIGLSYRDKDFPLQASHRPDALFHAASTMKTPVMVEMFRQIDDGSLNLNTALAVEAKQPSFLEAGSFECDAGPLLTKRLGQTASLRELCEQMITVSDNLATNIILNKIGYRRVNSTMRRLGAKSGYVLRGPQDLAAFRAGLSNRLSAADLTTVNEAIDRNLAASPKSCALMREILLAQKFNSRIPARLPKDVKVAHKTGSITGVSHDSGIVYAPFGTWYLTILMDEVKDSAKANAASAKLSRFIFDERKRINASLPVIHRETRIEWTASRAKLTRSYAEMHYSNYYLKTTGSAKMPSLRITPQVVVVHYTAGKTLKGAFATFAPETLGGRAYLGKAGALNVGIQFIVDRDGSIYEMMPDNAFGRHCIGLNHCAIGIENIGTADISRAALLGKAPMDTSLTRAQLDANVKLIRYLRAKHVKIEALIGHQEYRDLEDPAHPCHALFQENDPKYRTKKSDPGPLFMDALRKELADVLVQGLDRYQGQVFKAR